MLYIFLCSCCCCCFIRFRSSSSSSTLFVAFSPQSGYIVCIDFVVRYSWYISNTFFSFVLFSFWFLLLVPCNMCSMVTQKHQYKFNKKEFNKNGKKRTATTTKIITIKLKFFHNIRSSSRFSTKTERKNIRKYP